MIYSIPPFTALASPFPCHVIYYLEQLCCPIQKIHFHADILNNVCISQVTAKLFPSHLPLLPVYHLGIATAVELEASIERPEIDVRLNTGGLLLSKFTLDLIKPARQKQPLGPRVQDHLRRCRAIVGLTAMAFRDPLDVTIPPHNFELELLRKAGHRAAPLSAFVLCWRSDLFVSQIL